MYTSAIDYIIIIFIILTIIKSAEIHLSMKIEKSLCA